ncbi:multi-component transcriptional regulator [Calothrix sp. NIES-2100]|uniref:response regulator n=1 Tax=Calothrix sp. NIES-2100 TaxID=1954172 RepID=UPI000B5EC394|nr:multi-component transcriptional regulator [Calothrix sp. NIES-2100]
MRILLIEDDDLLAQAVATALTKQNYVVDIAADGEAGWKLISVCNYDLILLDVILPKLELLDLDIHKDSLKLLTELSQRSPLPEIPVLVFTERNNFSYRVEVARAGGRAFLQKSMPPSQILESVSQILQQTCITEARVMVVDDDSQTLTFIQQSLEPLGLTLKTLEDSRYFWDTLTEFSPDLLILDVEMPYINGIELCQVLRNDPYYKFLTVLFLVDNLNTDIVEQIFAIGADDCISKNAKNSQLITRLLNRLKRI